MSSQVLNLPFTERSVSVIMPVYNAAAFVERAVRSALACTEVGEVLIVEDGSIDGSAARCEALAEEFANVRVYQHPGGVNRGAGASRNLAISHAQLPFIAFLDADDHYLPTRFEAEHAVFKAHPDADGVYGAIGAEFHSDEARARYMEQFGTELITVQERVPPERLFSALMGAVPRFGHFSLDALTVRRSAVQNALTFDIGLRLHQDTDYLLRLAHGARLYPGVIDRPVAIRGVHPSNRITNDSQQARSKAALYTALEAWSRTVTIHGDDRRRLIARRIYWSQQGRFGLWSTLGCAIQFVRHPWLMRWARIREALLDRVFGQGTRLAMAARNATWRWFGDRGSYL